MNRIKTSSNTLRNSVLVFSLSSATFALAVERPAELDEKPHQLAQPQQGAVVEVAPQAAEQEQAAVPYLGVGSMPIDSVLAEHLQLEHGVVIQHVHEGSGAFKAGLQNKDILLSFAGRQISSPLDLRDAVRQLSVGDEVEVDFLRKGKQEKRSVTLAARPAGLPSAAPRGLRRVWPDNDGAIPGDVREQMDQLRGMIEDEFHGARLGLKLNDLLQGDLGGDNEEMGFDINAESTVTWADQEGDITMKMRDGQSEVVVRDHLGNTLYEGPWDTPQDKAAVAPELRQRIENMGVERQGNQFRFRMEGLPPGQ